MTCLFEKPAGTCALIVMTDVESGQRTEHFEHLDVAEVRPASLELAALQPHLAAGSFTATTAIQHTVDARRRPGVRYVSRLHRYGVRNA